MVCLSWLSLVLVVLGYPEQALAQNSEALAYARELAHPSTTAVALAPMGCVLHQLLRDRRNALEQAEAGIALAREQGFPHYLAAGRIVRGWTLADVASQLRKIPCEKEVAVIRPPGGGSGSNTIVTPPPACDPQKAADMKAKAVSDMNVGADAAALVEFEQSYHCKPDSSMFPVMVLTACRSSNAAKAKQYFAKCGSACNSVEARCIQLKITLRP